MVQNFSPTTRYENQVVGGNNGYSTLHREVARGGTFSAGLSREQARRLDPTGGGSGPSTEVGSPAPSNLNQTAPHRQEPFAPAGPPFAASAPFGSFNEQANQGFAGRRLTLVNNRFPGNAYVAPGGFAANVTGSAELGPTQVVMEIQGLGPLPDPNLLITPWLIADLKVPVDLDPQDLALLPRLQPGANQPGSIFTIDGQAPTIGRADVPTWNAIGIAVKPGELFEQQGRLVGHWQWDPRWNWALHPVALLGPNALGNHPPALPSGITMNILTDLFLRPATVSPELPLRSHFGQRLWQIWQRHLALWDQNRDGLITTDDVAEQTGAYLTPEQFQRVAITLEPPAAQRTTPPLLPTQQTCLAVGMP